MTERKGAGAPSKLSKEDLLKAIHNYKTSSASELAKKLGVERTTVYRRMVELGKNEIDAALGIIAESTLKPAETEKTVFRQLPIVKQFYETLKVNRETGEEYAEGCISDLYRVSVILKKNPESITPQDISEFLNQVKKGEIKDDKGKRMFGSGYGLRKAFRAWFGFRGIASASLTNLGIHSRLPTIKDPSRARARLTREHRHAIVEAARTFYHENFVVRGKFETSTIPFKDNPQLGIAMEEWFEFKYYTGTRNEATLNCRWEITKDIEKEGYWGVEWQDEEGGLTTPEKCQVVLIRVVDKGKHGGKKWEKKLIGTAKEHFVNFYLQLGKPASGLMFPFAKNSLRTFLVQVYKKANIPPQLYRGMPDHIWRHTGAQDLLDATDWNRPIVAAVLGWESEDILKKHYGEMPHSAQIRHLRKASGLPIQEVKREFVF